MLKKAYLMLIEVIPEYQVIPWVFQGKSQGFFGRKSQDFLRSQINICTFVILRHSGYEWVKFPRYNGKSCYYSNHSMKGGTW